MTAKLTNRKQRQRMAAAVVTTEDDLDDLTLCWIMDRENELLADVKAGILRQDELDVVRALLRLIFSPNVRMPRERLQ